MAQDFHLAKRHYDFDLGTNMEAPCNPVPFSATRAQLMVYLDWEGRWPQPRRTPPRGRCGRVRRGDGARRALLLYIRGRWVERLRREEQQKWRQLEQREERDDDGLFPPPGDPARDDWAVPQ